MCASSCHAPARTYQNIAEERGKEPFFKDFEDFVKDDDDDESIVVIFNCCLSRIFYEERMNLSLCSSSKVLVKNASVCVISSAFGTAW